MSSASFLVIDSGAKSFPPKPTRDALCQEKLSFQGLIFNTPSYGEVFWWETIAWWPKLVDRQAAYAAKRAAGDTHIILDLSGCYKENVPGDYNWDGADYSQNLPALVSIAEEAIREGFLIDFRLAGDGQGAGPDYNDPVGNTYGHDWLMANFPRIATAFAHLKDYIIFVPGYDGIFYGWDPEQVVAFGKLFRSIFPDGTLGLEFNTGHIPLGEGPGYRDAYAPGGSMQDYDVIYGEFDPFNYHADSTWQICGRLVRPYNRPSDQPAGDDPNPPFYMGIPNARGPWYFIAFEILTYTWVRGQNTPADIAAYKAYFSDMGCKYIC